MKSSSSKGLTYAGALCIVAFSLFPFVWMILVSLAGSPDFLSEGAAFNPTLENYVDVIRGSALRFGSYLRNSVLISSMVAVSATVVAGCAAYAITRLRFPGRIAVPVGLLALSMLPQISLVGYLFNFMSELGWVNTYQALALPYVALGLPLALWIMMSHFSQIPADMDKAALVDGATRFQILRVIIAPVAMPAVVSTVILLFI